MPQKLPWPRNVQIRVNWFKPQILGSHPSTWKLCVGCTQDTHIYIYVYIYLFIQIGYWKRMVCTHNWDTCNLTYNYAWTSKKLFTKMILILVSLLLQQMQQEWPRDFRYTCSLGSFQKYRTRTLKSETSLPTSGKLRWGCEKTGASIRNRIGRW